MARTCTTGNRLAKAVAAVTAYPFTLAAWVLMSSIAAGSKMILSVDKSVSAYDAYHTLYINGAVPNYEAAQTGVGANDAVATASVTTSAWAHVACVGTSATSRDCYLNGANKGSIATTMTPTVLAETMIGSLRTGAAAFLDNNGVIAYPAIWNAALSATDILSLSQGFSPRLIRPGNLVSYCRLDGNSPEQDVVSATGFTVTGTPTVAANPRIYAR